MAKPKDHSMDGFGQNPWKRTPSPLPATGTTGIDKGKGPDGEGPPLSPGERTPTGTESPLRPYCKMDRNFQP